MRKTRGGHLEPVTIENFKEGFLDAFGNQRVSSPTTLFDSKQIYNNSEIDNDQENQPLFFDNQETSGAGTSTLYNVDRASTTLGVSALTAGKRTRRTRMMFNYQPAKSQKYVLTFVMGNPVSGVVKQIGSFTEDNGIIFRATSTTKEIVIRSNVTGTPQEISIPQEDWNVDKLNGVGESGITLDLNANLVMFYDFEWLGGGPVRFGFFYENQPVLCHKFKHNNLTSVYMSTPNLPICAEIENDGTGAVDTFEIVCASVISEGGSEKLGTFRAIDPSEWAVNTIQANVVGTTYVVSGIRLKPTHLALSVDINNITVIGSTSDNFIVSLHFNPTVSDTVTWNDLDESGVQYSLPPTSSPGLTLTDPGYVFESRAVAAGFNSEESVAVNVPNAVRLGSLIDGTPDQIWLCVTPLSANLDILGTINWRELL